MRMGDVGMGNWGCRDGGTSGSPSPALVVVKADLILMTLYNPEISNHHLLLFSIVSKVLLAICYNDIGSSIA